MFEFIASIPAAIAGLGEKIGGFLGFGGGGAEAVNVASIGKTALGAGNTLIDTAGATGTSAIEKWISKTLTPPGTPTPSGSDPEYIRNVQAEMNNEYNLTVQALKKIDPNDTATRDKIVGLYESEKSAWGDPANPTRNVADPRGFERALKGITDSYSPPVNNSADLLSSLDFGKLFNYKLLGDMFSPESRITGGPITAVPQPVYMNTPTSPAQAPDYSGILIIGALALAALFFFKK